MVVNANCFLEHSQHVWLLDYLVFGFKKIVVQDLEAQSIQSAFHLLPIRMFKYFYRLGSHMVLLNQANR